MSGAEIGLAAGIFSAVTGAASALQQAQAASMQAQAQAEAASYQQQVEKRNALIAEQNRRTVLDNTRIDVEDLRRKNKRQLSAISAAYGNSGVEMAGSPLDALNDAATELELDVARLDYQGQADARALKIQSLGASAQADLYGVEAANARKRASYSRRTGFMTAGMALAGGGLTAYSDYKQATR